jgi:hypothetical protein
MHPIERLRYVARVDGADPALLAREAASALGDVAADDVTGLVPSCRRLIERHPANGPLWWLSARILASADPVDEARDAAAALAHDPTPQRLSQVLPDESCVLIVGWPDLTAEAIRARGDIEVLLADSGGEGRALARRLDESGNDVSFVPDRGIGAAASVSQLVVVEAVVAGPGGVLAAPGSLAAASVARRAGIPVWAVTGVGRVLPGPLWDAVLGRVDAGGLEPWDRDVELVAVDLLTDVVGTGGLVEVGAALGTSTCPVAPELIRPTA